MRKTSIRDSEIRMNKFKKQLCALMKKYGVIVKVYYSDDGWSMDGVYYHDTLLDESDRLESSIEIEEDN